MPRYSILLKVVRYLCTTCLLSAFSQVDCFFCLGLINHFVVICPLHYVPEFISELSICVLRDE